MYIHHIYLLYGVLISLQGNKFCPGDIFWCRYQGELPEFGRIYDIILIEKQVLFCLNLYTTKGINQHYHSFEIEPTLKKKLYCVTSNNHQVEWLYSLCTHSLRMSPTTLHIVIKCITYKL